MSITELIAAAKATVIDDEKIAAVEERMRLVEEKLENQFYGKSLHEDFWARTYSL